MPANMILNLAEQLKAVGATHGHMCINDIQETEGLTAVVSVYDNVKPAHMVLDELYAWAENNNEEVMLLIRKLESDMSWNTEK